MSASLGDLLQHLGVKQSVAEQQSEARGMHLQSAVSTNPASWQGESSPSRRSPPRTIPPYLPDTVAGSSANAATRPDTVEQTFTARTAEVSPPEASTGLTFAAHSRGTPSSNRHKFRRLSSAHLRSSQGETATSKRHRTQTIAALSSKSSAQALPSQGASCEMQWEQPVEVGAGLDYFNEVCTAEDVNPAGERTAAHAAVDGLSAGASSSRPRKRKAGLTSVRTASAGSELGERATAKTNAAPSDADTFLRRLMARRAARNAADDDAASSLPSASSVATGRGTRAAAKAARVQQFETRISAVEVIRAQIAQLEKVRAAAAVTGWKAGNAQDMPDLEPPPKAWTSAELYMPANGARSRGVAPPSGGNDGILEAAGLQDPEAVLMDPRAQSTQVLDPISLPVDAICAAKATDAWETEKVSLINEATRAHKKVQGEGFEVETAAWLTLRRLQLRSQTEAGRRTLMQKLGAKPVSALGKKAQVGRNSEGFLIGQTIANEFEATTFLPGANLASKIEVARPKVIGEWRPLCEVRLAALKSSGRLKDFIACMKVASDLSREVSGSMVGRLAYIGLTREYPFLIGVGLDRYVCNRCCRWVRRRNQRRHNLRCVGDLTGMQRVFTQDAGLDLGLVLSYKHNVKAECVEISATAQIEAAVARACWSCYWRQQDVQCAWRLAALDTTRTPGNEYPARNAQASDRSCKKGSKQHAADGGPDEADFSSSGSGEDDANVEEELEQAQSATSRSPSPPRPRASKPEVPLGQSFTLQSSLGCEPAGQPLSFKLPLMPAQLHTLGWMRAREDTSIPFRTTQTLRQRLAETDVELQVRLEREASSSRGGIEASATGFGTTTCMIALIAETRQQQLQELLPLEDWPHIAASRVLSSATLVVTPPGMLEQWSREILKFVHPQPPLRIITIPSQSKMKSLTVADLVGADIVLVSLRLFFSDAYQWYFDKLTKPGLKIWDEGSFRSRQVFLEEKQRNAARSRGRGRGIGSGSGLPRARGCPCARPPGTPTSVNTAITRTEADGSPIGRDEGGESLPASEARVMDQGQHPGKAEDEVAPEAAAAASAAVPTLQFSQHYLDLKEREDYLPRRYLDLERRTRRMLTEATAEELSSSPALLEMFHFKRVVFDVLHEVVQATSHQASSGGREAAAPLYSLHALSGRSHWGLTATPMLSDAASVATMASLLHVYIPSGDHAQAQHFLNTWVTSNTWDAVSIPLQEHTIKVTLSTAEYALYLHQRNLIELVYGGIRRSEGSSTTPAAARAAQKRLAQLCCHHDPEGDAATMDAAKVLEQTVQKLREAIEHAVDRQHQCEVEQEELVVRTEIRDMFRKALPGVPVEADIVCAHHTIPEARMLAEEAQRGFEVRSSSEVLLAERELRRLAQGIVEGRATAGSVHIGAGCEICRHFHDKDERLKQLSRARGQGGADRRLAEAQLRFLECVLEGMRCHDRASDLRCCACTSAVSGAEVAILPCGHCFHAACATKSLSSKGTCPECRRPSSLKMLTKLHAPQPEDPTSLSIASCGSSKLDKVVDTILSIQNEEGPAAKCVVFAQWDPILQQLESGLKANGISPLLLKGQFVQQQRILARFVDTSSVSASVLLLNLERNSTGMNLTCASHVLLIHPMHAANQDDARSCEVQAIGRVRRQGQQRIVHVHRFIACGTHEDS